MIWWIVLGTVLLALIVLAIVVRPVLARLPKLARAVRALQARAAQAEKLQPAVAGLQDRLTVTGQQAESIQRRLVEVREHRAQG